MARQYQRSIFEEFEDLREYMNSLFGNAGLISNVPLLPAAEGSLVPARRGQDLKVDVVDNEKEVVVTADMIPGLEKKDISLDLINSHALRICAERREEKEEKKKGYYLHERRYGSVQRIIPLPAPVAIEGAKSTYKNGVLEVHLPKTKDAKKAKIPIE
ncbi:MAG TPA: Hsp20/alpha crystallin family protein [Methanoregula sp.]|nr:Hsp20/alpha crystallin family protein [Methanoregula sp.]